MDRKFSLPPLLHSNWTGHLPERYDVEIGCGVGLHPLRYSINHPSRTLVAIERTHEKFGKFIRRYETHGRPGNLIPIQADAVDWIGRHSKDRSIERIFILYPNPYPKAKHLNRRWYAMPFTQCLLDKLAPGGSLEIRTNQKFYADEAYRYFSEIWRLPYVRMEQVRDAEACTHFEKKYLDRGEICWRLVISNDEEIISD